MPLEKVITHAKLSFKRRFFIGLLSFVQYLSTISTIIFYVFTEKLWFECI
jgi:hypothetical protein